MTQISPALLARIYPLNKLSDKGLAELMPGMRIRNLPARFKLFSVADKPQEYSYLLSGTLQMVDDTESEFETLVPDQNADMVPLPPAIPSLHRAEAVTDIQVLSVNRERLAAVLEQELPGSAFSTERSYEQARGNEDWRQAFLRARGLLRIGGQNLMALLERMQPVSIKAGEALIRQGEVADAFYVVASGRCEVVRTFPAQARQVVIAEYGPGASIGEDDFGRTAQRHGADAHGWQCDAPGSAGFSQVADGSGAPRELCRGT
jgi:CRP-like cAMP-binding protein